MSNFSQQLFLHSPQAVMVTDRRNRILQINPAFESLTGYDFADVAGEEPGMLGVPGMNSNAYKQLWSGLEEEGRWQGILLNRKKDGSTYSVWMTVFRSLDEQDEFTGYIAQFFDCSELMSAVSPVEPSFNYDELTLLPTWEMFEPLLDERIQECHSKGGQLAVMLVDLDRFKWINENLGRSVGDDLLQEVSRRLSSVVREADSLCRLSSDEFVIMFPDVAGLEAVEKVAQRVAEQLSHGFYVDHREVFVSASIGVAISPEHAEKGKALVKRADVAMYSAKQNGRNTYEMYTPEMERSRGPQILREEDLAEALDNETIQLCFLPVYDSKTFRVSAVHAMPVWQHFELGKVPFHEFAALIQTPDVIDQYDKWLDRALCQLGSVWKAYPDLRFISVRLLVQQIQGRKRVERWVEYLNRYQAEGNVMLEIDLQMAVDYEGVIFDLLTSDALLSVTGFAHQEVTRVKLEDVQPDLIKLDASLVSAAEDDELKERVMDSLIDMADEMEVNLLADGIISEGTRGRLMRKGCHLMQGAYFGQPLSLEQLLEHLAVEF